MANIFKLLKNKKTFKPEDSPDEMSSLENRTIVLDMSSQDKKEEKHMTDAERALKVPNQNMDLNAAAPLPDISKMAAAMGSSPIQMKTFDILVYELDDNGTPTQKKVDGVKATDAQELMMLYGAEGSKIKILREYGDEGLPQTMKSPQNYPSPPPPMGQPRPPINVPPPRQKEPPKYFEIGGVKCKLEDGKMYQEQWMKVDSSKYRLIADATNKLVSMNGKHLEMLKWVQIEDGEDGQNG